MKKLSIALSLPILMLALLASPAYAARPDRAGGGNSKPGDDGSGSASTIGYDVSYPQCGRTLPTDFAFAVIGVNGGLATTDNPCFEEQIEWAQQANGSTNQAKVQLYVNTANPWDDIEEYNVMTWPQSNIDGYGNDSLNNPDERYKNPYGACVITPENYIGNTNSEACSWQYGWNRAIDDVEKWFIPKAVAAGFNADPTAYKWWLDVEITNSWQAIDEKAHSYNKATLEGMVAYLEGIASVEIGVYSTNYQWGIIVGNTVTAESNLYGLDSWLAGARNEKDAHKRCKTATPLTLTSEISLIQYVSKNLDHNVSCIN